MAKKSGKGPAKKTGVPTSYKALKDEMNRLKAALRVAKKTESDPLERHRIDTAIKELGAAQKLFVCIQDHAPYRFNKARKAAKKAGRKK